jgi:hypothetical protein
VAGDSSSAQVLSLTQTNNPTISYYWVSGNQQSVSCTVVLTNGMKVTGKASFNVTRPTVQITSAKGTVGADSSFYLGTYLHYGTTDNSGTSCEPGLNGIACTYAAYTPVGFSGSYGWFPLNSSNLQYERPDGTWKQCLPSGYDATVLPFASHCYYDTPGLPLTGRIEAIDAETHQTCLMFQSSVTNSIWVPLKQVNWSWSGDAVLTNGTWELVSHSNPDPAIIDTTNFTWTSNWNVELEQCILNGF